MIGSLPLARGTRTADDTVRPERPPIPRTRANPEQSHRLCDLADRLESLASEEARFLDEADRLNGLSWEAHGNVEPGWGCSVPDCPRCDDPEHKRLWVEYSEMDDRGQEVAKTRMGIYNEIMSGVLAVLEENGIEPPGDTATFLAGEGRVRAVVEAEDTTFLLIGSVDIEYTPEQRNHSPSDWGFVTLAIL